jgi:carboxypeptidase family protein
MGSDRWARPLLAVLAVAALCVALAGCGGGGGGGSSSSSSSTRITGVVEDQQSSSPIAGATVQAGGSSAKTDANGAFALGVPPGKVTVTITAPGYQSGNFSAVADQGVSNDIGVLTLLNADTNPPSPPV